MKSESGYVKLRIKDGRIVCPACNKRTHQAVPPDMRAENMPLWCEHCRKVYIVDVNVGQCRLVGQCR